MFIFHLLAYHLISKSLDMWENKEYKDSMIVIITVFFAMTLNFIIYFQQMS
jgi:hypothetical protein